MKISKQQFHYVLMILASVGIWVGLSMSGLLNGLSQEAMRWRYQFRGEMPSESPIVYVNLDAEAISYIGDRPWNRRDFARLSLALLEVGEANAVGIDIIFSKFGPGALLDSARAREGDKFFGEVVDYYSDRLVLAAAYTGVYIATLDEYAVMRLPRTELMDPEKVSFPEAPTFPLIGFSHGRLGVANVDEGLNGGAITYWVPAFFELSGGRFSFHLLDGAMQQMSSFMDTPRIIEEDDAFKIVDKDGWVTFSVPTYSEKRLFTLGLEVFLAAHGLGPEAVRREGADLLIYKEGALFRQIPLSYLQSFEVNWFQGWGETESTPHYSIKEVLEKANELAEAAKSEDEAKAQEVREWFKRFKGKTIFVGPVDATLKDVAPTPFDREPTPKVAVHSNVYRTIEAEAYIHRVGEIEKFVIMIVLSCLASVLALWSGVGRRFVRFGALAAIAGYLGAVFVAFSSYSVVLPMIAPLGAALTSVFFVTSLKLGSEEMQRRRIKNLFGAYVSPELVDQIVESQKDPELGGAEAQVTALFSDVEGFSSLSEILPPAQLVALMNEYLSAMTDVLQIEGGTLDKYIGDAIVTMFGMPLPLPDHAHRACVAAMRMQERHAELRAVWAKEGKWPDAIVNMRTRIGLNTGLAIIGNMGSRVRFNYTMMGDSVNLAARCESGAKTYGVYTMITESTLELALEAGAKLDYRKLDKIVVKGRSEPVTVYELWDGSVDLEKALECKVDYEKGFQAYLEGEWDEALQYFSRSLRNEPGVAYAPTTPSRLLIERCGEFKKNPPDTWNGVYQMKTK